LDCPLFVDIYFACPLPVPFSFYNNVVPEQFTPNDVVKAIKKLNLKKSTDEFGITAEHLKHSSEVIAPILSSIFNHILADWCPFLFLLISL
jgi:hypothetical protein